MASAHCLLAVPVENSTQLKPSIISSSSSSSSSSSLTSFSSVAWSSSIRSKVFKLSLCPKRPVIGQRAKGTPQESETTSAAEAFTNFKHLLLPITDGNPYLSEGTREAAATAAALAKKYGADITVVVIDEKEKASLPEHDKQLSSIRWHLSEA